MSMASHPATHGPLPDAGVQHFSPQPRITGDVCALVADASARRVPLRIRAAATWLDAGRPVRAATSLDLSALSGVIEYNPGDLTLTARAGTPLSTIAAVTNAERQWLSLDPFGSGGTLGASIATASEGPLAHALGRPRDTVLGLEAVTGAGAAIRAGGRVVKNVAGFDLTRLMIGAWGTLGVLTEITVRLRALPEVDVTCALRTTGDAANIERLARALRERPLAPIAAELVNSSLSQQLALESGTHLLVRLAGNARNVDAQRRELSQMGEVMSMPAHSWTALAQCEPPGAAVMRLSRAPSSVASTWHFASTAAPATALVHATLARGIVRVVLAEDAAQRSAIDALNRFEGVRVPERMPAPVWHAATFAPIADDRLSRGVRDRFDPQRVLNPGILGEGS